MEKILKEKVKFLYQENEALELISRPKFKDAWDDLFENCPWATVFQGRDFVCSWYTCFPTYPKIIICDWDGDKMNGIITLTHNQGRLTGAGLDLAEYQAWLSYPEISEEFLLNALKVLKIEFPKASLYLKYLNDKVPIHFFSENLNFKKRTVIREYVHPQMELDIELLEKELKKKNKKEKINRLNRIGKLEFFLINDKKQFEDLIEEMALQSDFRKGALYNKTFFYDEPKRKTFLLKLFELKLLHVSGLKVDDKLIASNAGVMAPKVVYLQGINSHSPFYSKYSPGILHFLKLGISLKESGFEYFDLTPGGADGYKNMLATKSSFAYELWFSTKNASVKRKFFEKIKNHLKPFLNNKIILGENFSNLNLASTRLKLRFRFWLKELLSPKKDCLFQFLESQSKLIHFNELSRSSIDNNHLSLEDINSYQVNSIHDLFLYNEKYFPVPRMDFFSDCLTRIEFGQLMFTITQNKSLLGVFWYIPSTAKKSKTPSADLDEKNILTYSFISNKNKISLVLSLNKILKDYESLIGVNDLWIGINESHKLFTDY
jgi:CelD/BcsL family acetyltransferase involved in cellulose biosynthesis